MIYLGDVLQQCSPGSAAEIQLTQLLLQFQLLAEELLLAGHLRLKPVLHPWRLFVHNLLDTLDTQ